MPIIQKPNKKILDLEWQKFFYFNFLIGKVTHFRTIGIAPQFLSELRVQFRDFCLVSLDIWRCYRDVEATWDTRDVQRNKYFNWPEFWFPGPLNFKNPLYSKWFVQQSDTKTFNQRFVTKPLASLGGDKQAEKELNKNVLEIKNLMQKIGDLSKLKFEQKNFFVQ